MKTVKQLKTISFVVLLFVAFSCTNKQEGNPGMDTQAKEYQVVVVKQGPATLYKTYPAALQGVQTVEIRPRIAGYIEEILVDEGDRVRKGQVLFRLNANDLKASVRSAEAQVKVAQAQISMAKTNLGKTKPLVEKNIISKFDLETAEADLQAAEAQLAQAEANLANAKANLQYSVITSPTDGTIGTFPYRVGSMVSSASPQPLTSISNTTSMYVYFSMNEKEFLALSKQLEGNTLQEKLKLMPEVFLIMADNSVYQHQGRVETAGGLVDIQTGAVNMRAMFPNPEGFLRSGGSGSVRIPQHFDSALLIPQEAAYELQGKYFVYVVGEDNKVINTEVEVLVGSLKDSYIVTSGLNPNDRVVIEGVSSLRNGTPIQPKLVETDKQAQAQNSFSKKQVNN